MWEKVKRLGRNQRTILKVLAPCGGPPQPEESVRWLAALEAHPRREALRPAPGDGGFEVTPAFQAAFGRSLDRLGERGLVERFTVASAPGVPYVAPTADGWAAIEMLGLRPGP